MSSAVKNKLSVLFFFILGVLYAGKTNADEIMVAVSSNFKHAITDIVSDFETRSGHKVILVYGSTGRHYAQINNGAPFDVFLSADRERPELLENEGKALSNSRFTYALGKIVLWSPDEALVNQHSNVLKKGEFKHLAIANPRLAPYGKAATQILHEVGVLGELKRKIVRGENIGQTYQFVKTGNAELGFVAFSQLIHEKIAKSGFYWDVPQSLYSPIEQQAVLLKDNPTARAFLDYLKSKKSREKILLHGYGLPNDLE